MFSRFAIVRALIIADVAVTVLVLAQAAFYPDLSYIGLDKDIVEILKRNTARAQSEITYFDVLAMIAVGLMLVACIPVVIGLWFGKRWALWVYTIIAVLGVGLASSPIFGEATVEGYFGQATSSAMSMLSGALITAGFLTLRTETASAGPTPASHVT